MNNEIEYKNISTIDKIIPAENIKKLTEYIYENKFLLNSYPFKNSIEDSKIWAIEILKRWNYCEWVKDALN